MLFGRRRRAAAPLETGAVAPVQAVGDEELRLALEAVAPAWRGPLWQGRRPAADLARRSPGPAEAPALGATRLGGLPDLPESTPWPTWTDPAAGLRPMMFFAQVDLAGLAAHLALPLPSSGLLLFFCDFDVDGGGPGVMGLYEEDVDAVRVLHVPAGSALARTDPPGPVTVLSEVLCAPMLTVTVPDAEHLDHADRDDDPYDDLEALDQALLARVTAAVPDGYALGPAHRVGGQPRSVQGAPEEDLVHAASGASTRSGVPRTGAVPQDPADWLLLLQVEEDDALGTWLGDEASLYWFVHRDDLARGDLSRVRFVYQCM